MYFCCRAISLYLYRSSSLPVVVLCRAKQSLPVLFAETLLFFCIFLLFEPCEGRKSMSCFEVSMSSAHSLSEV